MAPDEHRRLAAIEAAAGRLRVDHTTASAVRALEESGIPSVLLKGPSIARWLYEPEDARIYTDCDLLVPPGSFDAAVRALTAVGFQPEIDEAAMPAWWREHALTTFHDDDGTMVDLHRSLPGVGVADERLWTTLSASATEIEVGDSRVRALSEPARLMHAALHAAQHGGTHRDLDVLTRAIDRVGDDDWEVAAALASRLDAGAAFAQGLALLPAGVTLAERLGLKPLVAIDVELRATGAVEALTVARLHGTRGIRGRVALVRHKLFPPATFMRKWSPLARRGRLGLAAAYVHRPLWVLRRTPRAVRAWQKARRTLAGRVGTNGPTQDG